MTHWTKKAKAARRWVGVQKNGWRIIYLLLAVIYAVVLILHLMGKDRNTSTSLDAIVIVSMLLAFFRRLRQRRQRT